MPKDAINVAIGVKRTWLVAAHMSAFDPKRTWAALPMYYFLPVPWLLILVGGTASIWPLVARVSVVQRTVNT